MPPGLISPASARRALASADLPQGVQYAFPPGWRVADFIVLYNRTADAASFQVIGGPALVLLQLFTVELRGLFQQLVQLVVLLRGRPVTCLARDFQAVTSGKVFDGLDKTQPVQFP